MGRAIIKAIYLTGIASAVLFWKIQNTTFFWVTIGCLVVVFISFWLLLRYARHGYQDRLNKLRERLLSDRTFQKRVSGDDTVDPLERDDVDVLIARIHRKTLDNIPTWAVCSIREIEEYRDLYEASPGLDPESQPIWLVLLNNLCLLLCPVLLIIGIVMYVRV